MENLKYKKIWRKALSPNEKIKYEFSVGKKYKKVSLLLGCGAGIALLFSPAFFIGILIIISSVLYFGYFVELTNVFALTNKRVIIYRGWISTDIISIDYDKITDITVSQSIFGRMTNSGNIIINTAGAGFKKLKEDQKLDNIENPHEMKKKLDEIRS